jgi:hypothetical protein
MPGFGPTMQEMNTKIAESNNSASERQKILDYFYYSYLDETPLDQMTINSINFREFIVVKETKCALDEVLQLNLLKNRISSAEDKVAANRMTCKRQIENEFIESFQGTQICWTLFHASRPGNLTRINAPSGFTQSAVFLRDLPENNKIIPNDETPEDSSSSEDETMQPLEIIRFMINFTQSESVKLDKPAVGSVSVHDPDEIRLGRLDSYDLVPGNFYEIFIEEQEAHLLPYPYDTDCYPYLELNQHYYENNDESLPPHPLFSKPLSSSDCKYGCLGLETVKRCGCWSPEIPFVNSLSYEPVDPLIINSSLTFCDWVKRGEKWIDKSLPEKTRAMIEFYYCFSSEDTVSKCASQCKRECIKSRIKSSYQSRLWPSDERIKYATMKQAVILKEYRNCCSIVSIRMSSNEISIFTYSAKYEAVEFISYIGGIVSLWMGFTFIGIFDCFKVAVQFLCRKKKQKEVKSTEQNHKFSAVEKAMEDETNNEISSQPAAPWYMNFEKIRSSRVRPLITVSTAPTRRLSLVGNNDLLTKTNEEELQRYRQMIRNRHRVSSSFS